ncbi:MAG: hypothetical protein F6J86_43060 [Symploca sp. SIO1B1]|nr:hypothetical protein [Symploca sp. SIO1B1]
MDKLTSEWLQELSQEQKPKQELSQELEQLLLQVQELNRKQLPPKSAKHKRRDYDITGKLARILPEECIGELEALHQRMKSQQRPLWFIQLRMLQEVVELLWAFYIQINLENLWLPGKNNRIDD